MSLSQSELPRAPDTQDSAQRDTYKHNDLTGHSTDHSEPITKFQSSLCSLPVLRRRTATICTAHARKGGGYHAVCPGCTLAVHPHDHNKSQTTQLGVGHCQPWAQSHGPWRHCSAVCMHACCAVYYSLVERIARMLSLPHGATERRVCTVTITTAHKHNQPSQSRQLSCRPDKAHAAPSLLEAPALFTYGALNPYARNHDRSTLWKMQPTQWEDQQTLSPPNGRINGPSIHRMEGPIDTLSTNPIHHMLPMPYGASSDDILCMPGTSDIRPLIASVRARVGGRERGGQNTRLFASEG